MHCIENTGFQVTIKYRDMWYIYTNLELFAHKKYNKIETWVVLQLKWSNRKTKQEKYQYHFQDEHTIILYIMGPQAPQKGEIIKYLKRTRTPLIN